MLIIGIDPGISGAICFFENGQVAEIVEMPVMADGKKNKRQVNGPQIYNVKKKLENSISNFLSTEIEWVPLNKIELLPVEKEEIINFLGILDDDDDVQNIYTNAKL